MTVKFMLNGEEVSVNVEPGMRLLDILRFNQKLTNTRSGCLCGVCGACAVILNGAVAASCLVPAFALRGCEVVTIEGLTQQDEYKDITEGWRRAGCVPCESCYTPKALITEILLNHNPLPSDTEILAAFDAVKCRCTESVSLLAGVHIASEIRKKRSYARS